MKAGWTDAIVDRSALASAAYHHTSEASLVSIPPQISVHSIVLRMALVWIETCV